MLIPSRISPIIISAIIGITSCIAADDAGKKETLRPRKLLPPTTIDIFLGRIEIALAEKDHDQFMELFSWTDSPANARTTAERTFADLTSPSRKDPDIEVGSLPKNYRLTNVTNGYKYEPNIKIEGLVLITFPIFKDGKPTDKMEQISLPFGRESGEYRFSTIKQSKIKWEGLPDKSLNVTVLQCGVTDKIRVKGYYIYNVSGVDVKEEFEGVGGYSKTFEGQYISECGVRIIEGKGAIRLIVREGGEEIYGSEEYRLTSSLIYRREIPESK